MVTSDGAGSREMLVSLHHRCPIWKTTYRVVLDQAGKPFFQGWAIIDNVGEEDWNSVVTFAYFRHPSLFYSTNPTAVLSLPSNCADASDLKLEPQVYEPGEQSVTMSGGIGTGNFRKDAPNSTPSMGFNSRNGR